MSRRESRGVIFCSSVAASGGVVLEFCGALGVEMGWCAGRMWLMEEMKWWRGRCSGCGVQVVDQCMREQRA